MYTNVLVPVDLEHKDQASTMIRTALEIAGGDTAMTLMFVMPEMPANVALHLPEGTLAKGKADAEEELRQLARVHNIHETARIVTTYGRAHREILELADRDGVDLIVIASHKPILADYLLGSVAASVVRHAKCSVHVLR
ncbi:MAG: universal stress protein [Hyphomicrobiaceae bacterium]